MCKNDRITMLPFCNINERTSSGKDQQLKPLHEKLMGRTALQGEAVTTWTTDQSWPQWKGNNPTLCTSGCEATWSTTQLPNILNKSWIWTESRFQRQLSVYRKIWDKGRQVKEQVKWQHEEAEINLVYGTVYRRTDSVPPQRHI